MWRLSTYVAIYKGNTKKVVLRTDLMAYIADGWRAF